MSDFQDFLKHQFASIAIGSFQPGKFDEVRRLYEKAVLTYQDGFKGAYLFQEPGTDRGISVIFWESVDEMETNQNPEQKAVLAEMTPLFAAPPDVKTYELVCEIKPSVVDPSGIAHG